MSQVDRQHHRAGRRSSSSTAPRCCGCGWPRRSSPRTCASRRPSWRGCRKPTGSCATRSATRSATSSTSIRRRTPSPAGELLELDQWILLRAENLVGQCRAWYEELAFHKVYHAVYDFAITDLSALYFDVLKDRLYTAAPRVAGAAQRADRAVPAHLRAGAPALAAPHLHHRRGVGALAQAGRRGRERPPGAVPGARRADPGADGGSSASAPRTGSASWKCATTC